MVAESPSSMVSSGPGGRNLTEFVNVSGAYLRTRSSLRNPIHFFSSLEDRTDQEGSAEETRSTLRTIGVGAEDEADEKGGCDLMGGDC